MRHTFTEPGRYIDTKIDAYTQDDLLHIIQYNVEHNTERTYEVGRVAFNADEFFQLYAHLAQERDHKFDVATQYCAMLMNMFGTVSLQTCREIWRVATHQCDHFLVLTGNKDVAFRMLAVDDPVEQLRLEENFRDQVVASCRYRKVTIKRHGFKPVPKEQP